MQPVAQAASGLFLGCVIIGAEFDSFRLVGFLVCSLYGLGSWLDGLFGRGSERPHIASMTVES